MNRIVEKEVPITLSNRHIHITEETKAILFGKEHQMKVKRQLSGDGVFAFEETVTICGPKGSISGVRVLGPFRKYNQVELLAADCYTLGVTAPIHMSGDLSDAAELKIVGPCGEVTDCCGIIAQRHIHVPPEAAAEWGIENGAIASVKINGVRGLTFDNVIVKISPLANHVIMHVDLEEGNAAGIKNDSVGWITIIQ